MCRMDSFESGTSMGSKQSPEGKSVDQSSAKGFFGNTKSNSAQISPNRAEISKGKYPLKDLEPKVIEQESEQDDEET